MSSQQKEFSLHEKYEKESGVVLISGIQALVRALHTRSQLDQRAGLNSGGFVSGYRGSPLGGLDKELWSQTEELGAKNIHFQPGVNEDLAATAVWGSQQVGLHHPQAGGPQVDGVFGLWYGKAPGLDRSCDAIRHANAWGTSAQGGVLLVVGDDPAAKSSSLSSQSEFTLQDMMVPILSPSDVQDVLDFAVLGWEMSRASGLWVGLKALADHMDSSSTVEVGLDRYESRCTELRGSGEDLYIRREDTPLLQEARTLNAKIPAAIKFARSANINRWVTKENSSLASDKHNGRAKLGIVAAGKAYRDVREALAICGLLTVQDIRAAGVEILKLGMTWPMDSQLCVDFAESVGTLLVVEEKRAFVETQIKEVLYGKSTTPVLGKHDGQQQPLIPQIGVLEVDELCAVLCELLDQPVPASIEQAVNARKLANKANAPARSERTPLFCAGCPHNTSTRVPEGSRATAGIGCHYMVQWMDRETDSCTQMGGEGVTWVGEAPFTKEQHIFANLGDGTYFHSGILAIRQAVAAQVNITYKILFNDAVAMTGGQPTDGDLEVADVIRQCSAEGVNKIVIVSDDVKSIRKQMLQAKLDQVEIYDRAELDAVQKKMREVSGVSVLVYQQTCATELRRRRKRKLIPDDKPRLMINQAVCDGCGDCTVQSSCVAVEPVETPQGVKRQINQTMCNKDLSCATGYCPAFVEVQGPLKTVGSSNSTDTLELLRQQIPTPIHAAAEQSHDVLITGVGGTGIVTLSALLAVAGKIDGFEVKSLDMTGLAQKGGAVFSHVRIAKDNLHSAKIPVAGASLLVGCDLVTSASSESLSLLSSSSRAVVNTHVSPTADFVLQGEINLDLQKRLHRVKQSVGTLRTVDAAKAVEDALGNTQQANLYLLGTAFQEFGFGISLKAMEQAIMLNGTAVRANLMAFHLGRQAAPSVAKVNGPVSQQAPKQSVAPTSLADLMQKHTQHLQVYGGVKLAQQYQAFVDGVYEKEQIIAPRSERLTRAVAESIYRLLTVKDEYEVARLYTDGEFDHQLAQQFGAHAKTSYLMAPPLLGTKKRRFGQWMKPVLRLLAGLKPLRNTWVDPFRFSYEHKLNQSIRDHYIELMEWLVGEVNLQNLPSAVVLAKLPQKVRGFGHVKQQQYERALEQEKQLIEEFLTAPQPVQVFDPNAKNLKSNQAA